MLVRGIPAAALLVSVLAAQTPARVKRTVTDAEVMRVHNAAILIDTHNDITSRTVAGTDIGQLSTVNHTDLPRMKKGGMGAQFTLSISPVSMRSVWAAISMASPVFRRT